MWPAETVTCSSRPVCCFRPMKRTNRFRSNELMCKARALCPASQGWVVITVVSSSTASCQTTGSVCPYKFSKMLPHLQRRGGPVIFTLGFTLLCTSLPCKRCRRILFTGYISVLLAFRTPLKPQNTNVPTVCSNSELHISAAGQLITTVIAYCCAEN
jgi:hypothetical protein